mmetsp:Transcript_16787/g.38782  ORF Transcript_16787/g.38782 Transcript_16787/m.38782 type:complete len:811 (+) Transcript_16787:89-2521(+)|eukprot:CAMPEP_0197176180 /NCGR_PEP_ID=MMETSP1423-20130617/2190_1 /TAXON_ID=476441 /ORGANISM="Pseudo-nitzschia heimii, Strain UNC1101" /LENGTH=810 /DNA_ID=CAMNT_0042625511 /DNA_START=70 /DNA_END=2502 /DNA_ORIENTATION=-
MKFRIFLLIGLAHVASGQNEFCDMCEGLGTPANPGLIVPFLAIGENDNPNCQQVYDFAQEGVSPNDDICSLIKSHKDFCGCPGASPTPLNSCSLCPEGATPMNLNARTPFEDTCSQLDTYLRFLPPDLCMTERVASIMRVDAFCGCPGVTADCYMCDDGSNKISNPDRKVPFYEFLGSGFSSTCQDLADFYTLYDTDDPEITTCQFIQMESGYCGCQSNLSNSPANTCRLCPDGSMPTEGETFISELQMTCSELELYMTYVPADQCEMPWIEDFKRFDYFCGCATAEAPCPICPDGSIEVSKPDAVIPYLIIPNNENPTCQQLATLGVIADPGELVLDDCSVFTAQAAFCGCPGTSKPEASCDFCPGGDLPENPSLVTPFGDTCEELNEYLSSLPNTQCDNDRVGFIKRQDFLCGCPSATTQCALCDDHGSNDVSYPDRHIPLLSLPLNTNPTCGEVVEFMSVNDGDLSDTGCSALQQYQGYCGCPATVPKNECSFCPNGGTPSYPDKIVSDEFTCQGLYDFVSFLRMDECTTNSSDFEEIQAFAYICGCPNVQPSCTLCPPGIDLPSASTLTGWSDGSTCGEYAEYVAALTKGQCESQMDEVKATASSCGCEYTMDAPVTTPTMDDAEKCPVQQNANLCTNELLDTVTEECDCYAFCDSKFLKCQTARGGLLQPSECTGISITGCNRAGVASRPVIEKTISGEKNTINPKANGTIVVIVAVIVPVVLALLTVGWYFVSRNSTKEENKNAGEPDANESEKRDLPIQAMEGSLSMADVVLTPSAAASPPAESFSIGEDENPVETNLENKIV